MVFSPTISTLQTNGAENPTPKTSLGQRSYQQVYETARKTAVFVGKYPNMTLYKGPKIIDAALRTYPIHSLPKQAVYHDFIVTQDQDLKVYRQGDVTVANWDVPPTHLILPDAHVCQTR